MSDSHPQKNSPARGPVHGGHRRKAGKAMFKARQAWETKAAKHHTVPPIGNRRYRRLATGRAAFGLNRWMVSGLPIRDTADCQSALRPGRTARVSSRISLLRGSMLLTLAPASPFMHHASRIFWIYRGFFLSRIFRGFFLDKPQPLWPNWKNQMSSTFTEFLVLGFSQALPKVRGLGRRDSRQFSGQAAPSTMIQ